MPRGGRPDPSPPGGIPPPRTDHGARWQTETPPANKFVAAMQRVKHFAEEEVGQRVVAYGARVESQLQARRGGPGTPVGPAAAAAAGAVVASSEKPGRRRAGKGFVTPESEPVPGDGARLGASRDHTDLFTRLRATAIFIRETETAARAADAREEAARNGETANASARDDGGSAFASSSSSPSAAETRETRNANANDDDPSGSTRAAVGVVPTATAPLTGSSFALVASAEALRKTKRAIEVSLLPQYVAFADSLSAAAAKARAARWTAAAPAGAALADAAQADVETHLATLLLVETELQQALKQLKTAHAETPGLPNHQIVPTVGLNIARLDAPSGCRLVVWDLGGRVGLRSIWERYYEEAHAVIFCVDLAALEGEAGDQQEQHSSPPREGAEGEGSPLPLRGEGGRVSGGITRARIKFNRRGRATLREKRAIRRIPAFAGRGSRRVHASSRSRRRARTFTLDQSLREALQVVARSTRRLDGQDPLRLERDAQVRRGRELRLRFPPIRTAGRPGGGL